ncbi:MAG: VCBS repeat-containing protein [Saprospiraceae bacterium]
MTFIIITLLISCSSDNNNGAKNVTIAPTHIDFSKIERSNTEFKILDSEVTGITADNKVKETKGFNHFLWASIYNGSGVGIADYNNDGLPDIYVGQNMTADKLYLNKGNMQFEDVSSGLPQDIRWTSGVSVVDINNDGLMDIYVCKFGPSKNPEDRRNQLLINKGNMQFENQAKQFGLDDWGYTTQAAFFDVDKDGDKDVYIINQPPDSRFRQQKQPSNVEKSKYYSDRLYIRNGSGRYVDQTEKYGLLNYAPGLNVLVNDINNDGWLDLFVSNDYEQPDFLYINQNGEKFTEEIKTRTGHISNFSMGSDIGDINNDGLNDIAVLDMSSNDHYRSKTNMGAMNEAAFWNNVEKGNHFQYMFNALHLNQGGGKYSEIGQLAGMAQTDWSWSVLIEDFNMDGLKDMYVTNGIKKDIRNNDFLEIIMKSIKKGKKEFQTLDLLPKIPSNPLSNFYFENKNGYQYSDKTKSSGSFSPNFSTGAATADIDRDGDLDIFASVSESSSIILENKTSFNSKSLRYSIQSSLWNEFLNATFIINTNYGIQRKDIIPVRGYLSSTWDQVIFGVPKDASINQAYVKTIYGDTYELPLDYTKINILSKNNLKKIKINDDSVNELYFNKGPNINYVHKENQFNDFKTELLLPHKLSENGPCAITEDIDNDGNIDLFIGGSLGHPLQQYYAKNGQWVEKNNTFWQSYSKNENQEIIFFDKDNDGDKDMYIVNGGNEDITNGNSWLVDQLFENDGSGNFILDKSLPSIGRNTSSAQAIDIDNDNDLDLIVFGSHVIGQYPKSQYSYVLENTNGKFKLNKTLIADLDAIGIVSSSTIIDYDGDGKNDIVAIGPWEAPHVLFHTGNTMSIKTPTELANISSWWTHINTADLNGDGKKEIILGSFGGNNKFHPSIKKPLQIFGNDFDDSGTNDVVLAKYYNDKIVPTRGRECSSQQIPDIQDKFPTYDEFALAGIEEILGKKKIDNGVSKKITGMDHYILWNSNNTWQVEKLPLATQISPLKSSVSFDINHDGIDDLIGIGNHYGAEVETARYDAGYGWVLLGSKDNKLSYVSPLNAGINLGGDGRALITAKNGNSNQLLAFFNNDKAKIFKIK